MYSIKSSTFAYVLFFVLFSLLPVSGTDIDAHNDAIRDRQKVGNFVFKGNARETAEEYLAIYLERVSINRVSKPDWKLIGGKEEGKVSIKIGPQKIGTMLYWSGHTKKGLSFEYSPDNVVFVAPISELQSLEFIVSVTENDEWDKATLLKVSEAIAGSGTGASTIPGYGETIGAGLGIVSSIFNLIAQSYKNTTELYFEENLFSQKWARGKRFGYYTIGYKHKAAKIPADVRLDFRFSPLDRIAYFFDDEELKLKEDQEAGVRVVLKRIHIPDKIGKRMAKKSKGLAQIAFNVGGTNTERSLYANAFKEKRFSMKDITLYKGKWVESGLPASISLTYAKQGLDFGKLVESTAKFAKTLIDEEHPARAPVIDITQTISSSVLASLGLESKRTLFSIGNKLLRQEKETVEFPMYSEKGKRINTIKAKLAIFPLAIQKEEKSDTSGAKKIAKSKPSKKDKSSKVKRKKSDSSSDSDSSHSCSIS